MEVWIQGAEGWVEITDYIAYQGWKVSRNDIDGPNAGRNIQGTMIRDRVTTKTRIDVTCVPLPKNKLDIINSLLEPESFSLKYRDDNSATWTEKEVYSNNYSWQYYQVVNGKEYYFNFGFPLIEI